MSSRLNGTRKPGSRGQRTSVDEATFVREYKAGKSATASKMLIFACPADSTHENYISRAAYARDRGKVQPCAICGTAFRLPDTPGAN